MRLINYLTEETNIEDIKEKISADCKPFIKQMKGADNLLYRGSHKPNPGIIKGKPRKNRRPLSIPKSVHKLLDGYFNDKFGWKARSSGLFCSGSSRTALFYGNVNTVWPIGNFKYVWSPEISDLFSIIIRNAPELASEYWPENPEKLKEIVDKYISTQLPICANGIEEIMISCKSFYLVKHDNITEEPTNTLKEYYL